MTATPAARYSAPARYLHWAVAGLIVLQFVLAQWAEHAQETGRDLHALALLANHKSVGMTVLMLGVARLLWRWRRPPPPLPAALGRWQVRAAHAGHGLLYGLLFALPITGWLTSSASAYSVSWFNLFAFPDLIASDPALKETFEAVHETLALLLIYVAVGHIVAALWHQLFERLAVLQRMTTPGPVVVGLVLLASGVALAAGAVSGGASGAPEQANGPVAGADPAASDPPSDLPAWVIDYAGSRIGFSAEQAGAPFQGRFTVWWGDIRFEVDQLETSAADVTVQLASVDTGDGERDATLTGQDWFGDDNARFRARRFEALPDGRFRTVDATLDFGRGAHPVTLEFAVEEQGARRILDGTATLDRTALHVGTGDWRDTTWVGQFVEVTVHVEATEL